MKMIHAPWTEAQVQRLNEYQAGEWMHPFTGTDGRSLIATCDGWVEANGGDVVQTWAWDMMLEPAPDWFVESAVPHGALFDARVH